MYQDIEHLRLLAIFHYLMAGIGALFSCFPMLHLAIGLAMLFAPESFEHSRHNNPQNLQFVGLLFTGIAAVLILIGWAISFCVFLAGQYLSQHRHYLFCLIIAGILCLFAPFGTVLGVFTIIVLVRPSVKPLFDAQPASTGDRDPRVADIPNLPVG